MDPRAAGRSFACRPRRRLHGRALLLGDPRVPSSLSIECKLCKCTDSFAHQLGLAKAPCELCDRLPVEAHRRARALSGRASPTERVRVCGKGSRRIAVATLASPGRFKRRKRACTSRRGGTPSLWHECSRAARWSILRIAVCACFTSWIRRRRSDCAVS